MLTQDKPEIVATIQAILPTIQSKPPTTAQSYLATAKHLFSGVELLSRATPRTAVSCAFLAAQMLECLLKSYLSNTGVCEKALKDKNLRHNLEGLWLESVHNGLTIQSHPPQWCQVLSTLHDRPYYLRYPMNLNGMALVPLLPLATDLEHILHKVEASFQ